MTTKTLNGKTILIEKVPDDSINHEILDNSICMVLLRNGDCSKWCFEDKLPEGQWSILGRAKDVGEEQARGLVLVEEFGNNGYKDFGNATIYFTTALESFQLWLKAEGIKETDLLLIKNNVK